MDGRTASFRTAIFPSTDKGITATPPSNPDAIRGREPLVPGKTYELRYGGQPEPLSPERFTFLGDIDGKFCRIHSVPPANATKRMSYADMGVEPYGDSGKITGWNKYNFVVTLK